MYIYICDDIWLAARAKTVEPVGNNPGGVRSPPLVFCAIANLSQFRRYRMGVIM